MKLPIMCLVVYLCFFICFLLFFVILVNVVLVCCDVTHIYFLFYLQSIQIYS